MSLTLTDPVFLDACRRRNPEAWNLVSTQFDGSADVSAQETTPRDLAVSPDGTKAFLVGTSSDAVHQYNVTTPWDVMTLEFVKSNDLGGFPTGIFFKPDGSKMYIADRGRTVNQYALATNWDIESITLGTPLDVSGDGGGLRDMFITADGLGLYVTFISDDRVAQYTLSTRWDTSTATHVRNYDTSSIDTSPVGLFFRPDGRKMYFIGNSLDRMNEFTLTTPWNIAQTNVTHNRFFDISAQSTDPTSVFFKPDGLEIFVCDAANDRVLDYRLGYRWNVELATYVTRSEPLFTAGLHDIFFNPEGTVIIGASNFPAIGFQTRSLGTAWDLSTMSTSPTSTLVPSAQQSIQSFHFRPNGLNMFSISVANGRAYSYELPTAWSMDNATQTAVKDLTPIITDSMVGITLSAAGDRMYICGDANDNVYEVGLGTAWDLSSAATLTHTLSTSANFENPSDVFFNPDGTQLFVSSVLGMVDQYDLDTAWDLSSADHIAMVSIAAQVPSNLRGIFMRPDGLKMYTADSTTNRTHEYDI